MVLSGRAEVAMFELVPTDYLDVTKLALAGFFARYREPTLTA